ncbi:hypothetical protein BKI52_21460 [marine bacterium AO1-C]|nr:hypothetical protein BKI52_21460 [marine bacterium AO1-C]
MPTIYKTKRQQVMNIRKFFSGSDKPEEVPSSTNSKKSTFTIAKTYAATQVADNSLYDVDKSADVWQVTFSTKLRVRFHSGVNYMPFTHQDYTHGKTCEIAPGQWLEGKINEKWVHLSDLDHR